jgi:hypothetical protein
LQDEDYVDYRAYPIKINWPEIENKDSEACIEFLIYLVSILIKNGYFGVGLYFSVSELKIKGMRANNYIKNIAEFYFNRIERNSYEDIKNAKILIDLLPKLKDMKFIIEKNIILNKEIFPFIITLYLYEHYLRNFDLPFYKNLFDDYLPTSEKLYSIISDVDINNFYTNLKSSSNRELYNLLKNKLKIFISNKRLDYLDHVKYLKNSLEKFNRGINFNKFLS